MYTHSDSARPSSYKRSRIESLAPTNCVNASYAFFAFIAFIAFMAFFGAAAAAFAAFLAMLLNTGEWG